MAEIWLHAKHGGRASDDVAGHNPRIVGGDVRHPGFFRMGSVGDRGQICEQLIFDLGYWAHFVGDGSQPLHVTYHYNGWGPYPNPKGYTTERIHGPFEGDLVQAAVTEAGVEARMLTPKACDCAIARRVADYLAGTGALVVPLYELEKAGGLAPGDPRGPAFAARQIAVGASELRDLIVQAWRVSANETVGYKPVAVADVVAGRVDPYPALYGTD